MSKFVLRERTQEASGVSHKEMEVALELSKPCLYERLGKEEGIEELSTLFYNRVFDSDTKKADPWFFNIFASSTKAEAIENQYRFFVQTFGGPDLYAQKKGKYTRLVGRHANYPIGHRAAKLWVELMMAALEEHSHLQTHEDKNNEDTSNDEKVKETKKALQKYFTFQAHYIVVASEYMRPDQLSGGNQIDEGRVW
jgi:truncated hemoglobin YjbI